VGTWCPAQRRIVDSYAYLVCSAHRRWPTFAAQIFPKSEETKVAVGATVTSVMTLDWGVGVHNHSYRSATIGLTCEARCAGRYPAAIAAGANVITEVTMVVRSVELTPKRGVFVYVVPHKANSKPTAIQ
jgi:hypothetical protein